MKELTCFKPEHARRIIDLNGRPTPIPVEEMTRVYTSPGSVALTLMVDGEPAACGGIIDLTWHRGEAWLLTSPWIDVKSAFRYLKKMMPLLAQTGGFRRVQATSFDLMNTTLFEHLGFKREGVMDSFGPCGESAILFSRIFPWEAPS